MRTGDGHSVGYPGLLSPSRDAGAEVSISTINSGREATVVAVRLPSPGHTICYSDGLSLSAPTPFSDEGDNDRPVEDEL